MNFLNNPKNFRITTISQDWNNATIKQRIWFTSLCTLEIICGILAIYLSISEKRITPQLLLSLAGVAIFSIIPAHHN